MQEPRNLSGAGHGPPHYLEDAPIPFGTIEWHQPEYHVFACSRSTASWLTAGGMRKIDGKEVVVEVNEECKGGHNVFMRWFYKGEV